MPRRIFQIGEVLTAQNINTFLMDQAVMTFADSAARSSAIGTPVEGMLTYLEDSGAYEYFDGAAYEPLVPPPPAGPAFVTTGTASLTLASSDAGSTYVFTNAAATATISTATAFAAGDRVDIVRDGATSLTIVGGAGVVFAGKGELGTAISFTVDEQYQAASVLCVGTDAYRVIGAVTKV
jgi:hypothetical protein